MEIIRIEDKEPEKVFKMVIKKLRDSEKQPPPPIIFADLSQVELRVMSWMVSKGIELPYQSTKPTPSKPIEIPWDFKYHGTVTGRFRSDTQNESNKPKPGNTLTTGLQSDDTVI